MKSSQKNITTISSGILVTFAGFLFYRKYKQRRILKATTVKDQKSKDEIISFNIGDTVLKGLVRGKSINNPVLLCVHGGPGIPDMLVSREFDNDLIKDFTVIRFDQRGTGKSYDSKIKIENLTVDNFVNDIIIVARQVRVMFPGCKVFLHGRSWGSIISMLAVKKEPNAFDAYIGAGQIVNINESEPLSYDYILNKASETNNKGVFKSLQKINRNNFFCYIDQLSAQRMLLLKTNGIFFNKKTMPKLLSAALFSPDYTTIELMRTGMLARKISRVLYLQLAEYDLFTLAASVNIPCYFIEGRHDFVSPASVTESYFKILDAPLKEYFWFEKSGHFPPFEEPERFLEVMKTIKLQQLKPESNYSVIK